jgi:site-specific recombinase XerD
VEYLPTDRNLALNTQHSYRDMFCLLIPFVTEKLGRSMEKVTVTEFSADVVREFLKYLKDVRKCSTITCNQRLAAIHAFAQFVGRNSPEHIEWSGLVRDVPFKRYARTLIHYLEKPEMDALLAAPDQRTDAGRRDYGLLLFLYNAGARATEAAEVRIGDLYYSKRNWNDGKVEIHGKGGKTRQCPLWPLTVRTLDALIGNRPPDCYVFLNRLHEPIKRCGIWGCVKRHAKTAAAAMPSIAKKQVSPHVIRHSAACHLLRSGVDMNTIRDWLGHVEISTTNIYAQIDLEMKAKALAKCEITEEKPLGKRWRDQTSLMEFLRNL